MARDGINDIFDIFERSHELRLNSEILVARGSDAASVMKLLTPVESLPALGLVKKAQNTSSVWGRTGSLEYSMSFKALLEKGI